jgi:hypothetical protein
MPLLPGEIRITGAGYDPTVGKVHLLLRLSPHLESPPAADGSGPVLQRPADSPHRPQSLAGDGRPHGSGPDRRCRQKPDLNLEQLQQRYPRQREIPFDSRRRMMTVVLDWRDDLWPQTFPQQPEPRWPLPKEPPWRWCATASSILRDGTVGESAAHEDWQQVVEANDALARQGFRVLGLAIRPGGEALREMKAQDWSRNWSLSSA